MGDNRKFCGIENGEYFELHLIIIIIIIELHFHLVCCTSRTLPPCTYLVAQNFRKFYGLQNLVEDKI